VPDPETQRTAALFEVRLTVANPDPDGQVFAMPAWIPGSYMIRDYARNVVAIRAESDGLDVPLEKLDKSCWRAAPVQKPLTLVAEIYGYDLSVRGAHLDNTHAYFNGPCVFFSVRGQEDLPCEVEIVPPAGDTANEWRGQTNGVSRRPCAARTRCRMPSGPSKLTITQN
jgi:predicted metalloprotease with PDZ domain